MRIIEPTIYVMLAIAFATAVPSGVLRKRSPRAAKWLTAFAMFISPASCTICFACVHSMRSRNPDDTLTAVLTLGLLSSPILVAFCGISALAGVLVGSIFAVGKVNREGLRCKSCGYLLRGLTVPRCPECGAPFDPILLANAGTVGEQDLDAPPPTGD